MASSSVRCSMRLSVRQQQLVRQHNEAVLEDLDRGDLVEFPRDLKYSHWGVYIGNGNVVHLLTIFGQKDKKASVQIDHFLEVADQSMARKNNDTDRKLKPKTGEEIVKRALKLIGAEIEYNVLSKNCEHFVSYCRYGVAKSDQVEKAYKWYANWVILIGALVCHIIGIV